ncbi:hypothetical protein ACWCXX_06310 [Streptomyces sp. NPDC001732]
MRRDTTDQPRDGNGKYEYVHTAVQRDAAASLLKAEGKTYQEIADELGYYDRGHVWRGVQRARRSVLREPAEELVQVEADRLDELYVEALAILERDHVMVSHGKVVCDENGVPIRDDGPRLAALRELRQIRKSYRKLHGLDSPAKVDMGGELKYEVVGVDPGNLV